MKYLCLTAFGVYLFIISIKDIYKKRLDIRIVILGILFAPGFILCFNEIGLYERIMGLIPGAILYICSLVSREGIGLADILEIILIGLCTGIGGIITVLSVAFLLIAFLAGIMIAFGRLKFKSRVPFLPFLFTGYVFMAFTMF